jgi:hypothetical protein
MVADGMCVLDVIHDHFSRGMIIQGVDGVQDGNSLWGNFQAFLYQFIFDLTDGNFHIASISKENHSLLRIDKFTKYPIKKQVALTKKPTGKWE